MKKLCRVCNEEKDSTYFYTDRNKKTGLSTRCKKCFKLKIKRLCMPLSYNHEQIVCKIQNVHGDKLLLKEAFKGTAKHHKFQCKEGHEWNATINAILQGTSCRICSDRNRSLSEREFLNRLPDHILLDGDYIGKNHPVDLECKIHGKFIAIRSILATQGEHGSCPLCIENMRVKNNFYEYKNMYIGSRLVEVQGFEPFAIKYLLENGVKAENLYSYSEGKVPKIYYSLPKEVKIRKHYPDMFDIINNTLYEVKSIYTLGYYTETFFIKNKSKCEAALKCGYEYRLILSYQNGDCKILPKHWSKMSHCRFKRWYDNFKSKKIVVQ